MTLPLKREVFWQEFDVYSFAHFRNTKQLCTKIFRPLAGKFISSFLGMICIIKNNVLFITN